MCIAQLESKGIKRDYEEELAKRLYQDTVTMDIVNDYLWENSSNKEGDGIQPLVTWDFSVFRLITVQGERLDGGKRQKWCLPLDTGKLLVDGLYYSQIDYRGKEGMMVALSDARRKANEK